MVEQVDFDIDWGDFEVAGLEKLDSCYFLRIVHFIIAYITFCLLHHTI